MNDPHQPLTLRIATFNAGFNNTTTRGELRSQLADGKHKQAQQIAAIVARLSPDILLLNEIDTNDNGATVDTFQRLYLDAALSPAARFSHCYVPNSNTGVISGHDYLRNGNLLAPGNAYGFGHYPGQFGMALFSRYPLLVDQRRTFQRFRWKDMPGAQQPLLGNQPWFSPQSWSTFRLSSKNHVHLPVDIHGQQLHLLASHPTPPVFDGRERRNAKRNFDEIRLWADYVTPGHSTYLYDDQGNTGVSLPANERFVILGDLNASSVEGDSLTNSLGTCAIDQLLRSPLIQAEPIPASSGGKQNDRLNPHGATHTASWKMRADYILPAKTGLQILQSGVFWPAPGEPGAELVQASDHRLVWMDLKLV